MTVNESRYANWKAPSQDGQLLIWPEPARLLQETRENASRLSAADDVRVQGVPVARLRQNIRHWLGHDGTADRPLIATGHQTELYHPGVWAKIAAVNAIAECFDGDSAEQAKKPEVFSGNSGAAAFHFAVDTDQPKHLSVRWPGTTLPITDDPALASADWSGLLAGPTPAQLQAIESALQSESSKWNFQPLLEPVLKSLRKSSMESIGLSAAITSAQHELDWDLGLRHHAMLVSPMLFSQTYLVFVHHVLSHAGHFAADYNVSLAEYRAEAGISSQTRPMPDLSIGTATIEVPFWFDDLSAGSRKRAEVSFSGNQLRLSHGDDLFVLDPTAEGESVADKLGQWLRNHSLRLSPRALTLTTFLRLLVVDNFIHGIGGGRYDQVTDRLLERHFKIDPPRFAVATGTMFFPGSVGRSRVCMPCVVAEGHRLKHNLLGERKRAILNQIDALPRRSVQRSLAFHNMHGALSAAAVDHPALKEWNARLEETAQLDREETVLFDRELFYAMQTRHRLEALIARCRESFAGLH